MDIESELRKMEYERWCAYNHEHINEYGEWVSDDPDEEEQEDREDR